MEILVFGILLWSIVHFVPSIALPVKKNAINLLGENGYKLTFTLVVILSLVMIVYGWRHTIPVVVYTLPLFVKPVSLVLMIVAFLLFGAGKHPTRIKSFVRHPQLMSIITWSIAHLLVNGDSRSIVLFGGMGVWAIIEIFLINRRDGEWIREPAPAWSKEIKGLVISIIMFVIVVAAHPYIAGVSIR